ncbi:MAG: archaeal heat shock protein Hsp20 [Candidatus Hydrothermarchaeota archaeon]
MSWRRRRRDIFDIFGHFGDAFEEIEEMIDRMFRTLEEEEKKFERIPLVYGFSLTMGADGKPLIQRFGNVQPMGREFVDINVREPFADIIEDKEKRELIITVEMPGVEKEDIKIEGRENSIVIKAEGKTRKYRKEIPLDKEIELDKTRATYKNGILEVRTKLKKVKEEKSKEIRVD